MDIDVFKTTGDRSGTALQWAWFGPQHPANLATATSRHHMTITSCMAQVRRVLYAAGRAMKLGELHEATGHERAEIGSVLVKLQRRGLVLKVPPVHGGRRGCGYLWAAGIEPSAKQLTTI